MRLRISKNVLAVLGVCAVICAPILVTLILVEARVPVPFTSRYLEFRMDTRIDRFVKIVLDEKMPSLVYSKDIAFQVLTYRSSVDGVGPLYANLIFNPKAKSQPVIVFPDGYSGNRSRVLDEQVRIAEKGFVVVVPDMRGRGVVSDNWNYKNYAPRLPYPDMRFDSDMNEMLRGARYSARIHDVFVATGDRDQGQSRGLVQIRAGPLGWEIAGSVSGYPGHKRRTCR